RMTVTQAHANLHGTAHGGYLFLLADAAFAHACNSDERPAVAQSARIVYMSPARPGDVLSAEAVERSRQGRRAEYKVTIHRSDGEPIATFHGHSTTLPPPA